MEMKETNKEKRQINGFEYDSCFEVRNDKGELLKTIYHDTATAKMGVRYEGVNGFHICHYSGESFAKYVEVLRIRHGAGNVKERE